MCDALADGNDTTQRPAPRTDGAEHRASGAPRRAVRDRQRFGSRPTRRGGFGPDIHLLLGAIVRTRGRSRSVGVQNTRERSKSAIPEEHALARGRCDDRLCCGFYGTPPERPFLAPLGRVAAEPPQEAITANFAAYGRARRLTIVNIQRKFSVVSR